MKRSHRSIKVAALIVLCIEWRHQVSAQTRDLGAKRCVRGEIKATVTGSGGAAGSLYTEVSFENVSRFACTMQSTFHLEQVDEKGALMPIEVSTHVPVNAYGEGFKSMVLTPGHKIAVTIRSLDRTLDSGKRCATEMHISLSAAQTEPPLLIFKTVSCAENVSVTCVKLRARVQIPPAMPEPYSLQLFQKNFIDQSG